MMRKVLKWTAVVAQQCECAWPPLQLKHQKQLKWRITLFVCHLHTHKKLKKTFTY